MTEIHPSTHWLKCKHVIGGNVTEYQMACDVLKRTKRGRLKVRVYGNRYWGGSNSRIRYVLPWRVIQRGTVNE